MNFNRVLAWLLIILALTILMFCHASAQIRSAYPPLTPAQAAEILRPNQSPVAPQRATGPVFVILPSMPGAISWLEFPPMPPPRRLDGTLLDRPPVIYGAVYGRSQHDRRH